jgi:hypothetical protein
VSRRILANWSNRKFASITAAPSKNTGDGVLAEFASVVDAVRCAAEIQRAMADRDLDLAEERRLRFRIGINLGDVIADGDDIYGDGVKRPGRGLSRRPCATNALTKGGAMLCRR